MQEAADYDILIEECNVLLASSAQAYSDSVRNQLVAAKSGEKIAINIDSSRAYLESVLLITDRLIEMEPQRGLAWLFRSQALRGLKRAREALAACERAIELEPNDADSWCFKASILDELGEEQGAKQAIQISRELRE